MRRNKEQVTIYFILFSLLLIGVVYAILQANLQINGTAKIKENTWDIHFNNIQVNEDSVSIGTGDSPATIDSENNCKIDFEVTLSLPGDFYEFTVDVVNAGTIDGMIGEFNKTLKINNEVVSETPNYLEYSVTYADGMEILENHKLAVGSTETYKVRLEFKTDIEELPPATTITTSLEPQYLQADSSSIYRVDADFVTSSWDEIVKTYKIGNLTKLKQVMEAGTTREVQLDMNYDGIYEATTYVRIVNLSTPSKCSEEGFSQTACGFVIEFADIITTYRMNPSIDDGNAGGWEKSDMRAYINSTKYLEGQSGQIDYTSRGLYNTFPLDLKKIIINTKAVSGFGQDNSVNFITNDKIYLLSTHEILNDNSGSSYGFSHYDTAYNNTRQLDYYSYKDVTGSNYSEAIKKTLSGTASTWWLRSARYNNGSFFYNIRENGKLDYANSVSNIHGVSPAFRIAA